MNQLRDIQHQFWNGLRSVEANANCTQLFSKNGKLTQEERLNIYRDTMCAAHTNALAQSYRCCEKILGERYFKQIAKSYFYKYPATIQNLNHYGQSFPKFLQHWVHNHMECSDYPYLSDLAQLEWAFDQAYYAKPDPLFNFNSLTTLNEKSYQRICFELSASLTILKSNYPIYEIWLANQGQADAQEINAITEPQYLCVTREDFKPIIYKVDQIYFWMLEKIQYNSTFSELEASGTQEEVNIPLQKVIPELIQKKWICSYHLNHK